MERLSLPRARRIALGAQGLSRQRPTAEVTGAHLRRVVRRLGLFQIDSVNVLQRAHYLPLYSRMGAYDLEMFHRAAGRAPRAMFEYWAHEASFVDVNLWPALQHRMVSGHGMWGGVARIAREEPDLVERVFDAVAANGPVTARDIDDGRERERSGWGWNWSQTKTALEYLFHAGRITVARRNAAFERAYDLPSRVIPAEVLSRPVPDDASAHRILTEHAARALGIATEQWLRDYFRTAPSLTRVAIESLAADGVIRPVEMGTSGRTAWLHTEAVVPRAVHARTLLSPFDALVFERSRTEALFGFRYRIEIYVPKHKREYGYYVLPFLLGDALVARVDLKADRAARRLLVLGAWSEPGAPSNTAAELAAELVDLAGWLGLGDEVEVAANGDLADDLMAHLP